MKFRADLVHSDDTDFARQQCVCPAQHRSCIHGANGLDVRDLAVRMNTCICTPGTRHADLMIEKLPKSLLDLTLNRTKLRLNLPTVEVRPVIGKRQLEVPHSIGYSMCLGWEPCSRVGRVKPINRSPRSTRTTTTCFRSCATGARDATCRAASRRCR